MNKFLLHKLLFKKINKCYLLNSKKYHYDSSTKTDFGFKSVNEAEKFEKVNDVFSNVANKYDLMNDCMSLGIHRLWKDQFIKELLPVNKGSYLDVAGGTGDIAFRILDYIKKSDQILKLNKTNDTSTSITICDINHDMLNIGRHKGQSTYSVKDNEKMKWIVGDAENLNFADDSFDAYTISFGIRNCVHIEKVLDEAYRVLKPGGRFLCLEFGKVDVLLLKKIYSLYSFQVIPLLGHLIAGDWNSYQYLVESINKFPSQEEFKTMIENANFSNVSYKNLTFGVAAISSGFKI